MLASLVAAFKLPDLRKRILFLFIAFAVFAVGRHIPLPGIDREALSRLFANNLFGFLDIFSGGALRQFTILALGIMPYINATIIFQLLTLAWPELQEMAREGETGRRKIAQYTRYLTMALAMLQGFGLTMWLRQNGILSVSWATQCKIVLTLTAGTAFLMWLGEEMTDKGVGNGVSLLIFAGIMARIPQDVWQTVLLVTSGSVSTFNAGLLAAIVFATIMGIVFIQQGERRIPVQYAKRVVGTRMMGGASTYLPVKVNSAGVMPIIFAISVALFPMTVANFIPASSEGIWGDIVALIDRYLTPGKSTFALVLYFALVVGFTYFYTAATFDPLDVADNMRKWGGFVPGIRPGRPTAEYLDRVLVRVTFAGAIFLGVIAVMQYVVPDITRVASFSLVGGTSLLIVVGVALETMQQIEAHLLMRHYEGFIK
ncbi:MAG TPA: preprotein translocase subunit SecY [Armatimonadetes bacterium]|nr:preprotein translocase subunit SecY [Armatimonadota bacterium]